MNSDQFSKALQEFETFIKDFDYASLRTAITETGTHFSSVATTEAFLKGFRNLYFEEGKSNLKTVIQLIQTNPNQQITLQKILKEFETRFNAAEVKFYEQTGRPNQAVGVANTPVAEFRERFQYIFLGFGNTGKPGWKYPQFIRDYDALVDAAQKPAPVAPARYTGRRLFFDDAPSSASASASQPDFDTPPSPHY